MENPKFTPKVGGVALAMAAAGLISGCTTPSETIPASNSVELVQCHGVNACKGHNDCATAENKCAGHASCKGAGWVAMPEKACGDVAGKAGDKISDAVPSTDLIHCYGVNTCKGHNDCGKSENSCAGKAACKGHGFVATTEKSCSDIGGEVGAQSHCPC